MHLSPRSPGCGPKGGDTGVLITWAPTVLHLAVTAIKRGGGVSGFVVLPRRWAVERSFVWLLRSRRLARDYERRPDSSEAMIMWSMARLMTGRLTAPAQARIAPKAP